MTETRDSLATSWWNCGTRNWPREEEEGARGQAVGDQKRGGGGGGGGEMIRIRDGKE